MKKQRKYAVQLLVGHQGSGKTTEIIKAIKYYIAREKKLKNEWRVWVFTSTPTEFKKFKPETKSSKFTKIKNQVFVSSDISLFKNKSHVFCDGLVVMDNGFANEDYIGRGALECLYFPRSKRLNSILSYSSLLQISPRTVQNASWLKVFDMCNVPTTVGQRKMLNSRFANLPIIDIAHYVTIDNAIRYGYNHNNPHPIPDYDRYTLVDIGRNKVICNEEVFYRACRSVSEENISSNILGLIQLSEKLAKYATYFEQKY